MSPRSHEKNRKAVLSRHSSAPGNLRRPVQSKAMWKAFVAFAASTLLLPAQASELTELEQRWLQLSWPVVTYAKRVGLPLDIVVQPHDAAGEAPLAMAYVEGRCKLVLSMRGNAEARRTLAELPPALLKPAVEAMAAHELGHCWRYVQGAWHTVPAGFTAPRDMDTDAQTQAAWREMQHTRREEGFADLVGLAWTQRQHPQHYAAVHAWLVAFRDDGAHPGHHHDTLAWVRLARDPRAFALGETPFEQAAPLWQAGLQSVP